MSVLILRIAGAAWRAWALFDCGQIPRNRRITNNEQLNLPDWAGSSLDYSMLGYTSKRKRFLYTVPRQ